MTCNDPIVKPFTLLDAIKSIAVPGGETLEFLQACEASKRKLGRLFDRAESYEQAFELWSLYNDYENAISYLCDKYKWSRLSKPYKLPLSALDRFKDLQGS